MKTPAPGTKLSLWTGIAVALVVGTLASAPMAAAASPSPVGLGTAAPFAVLAGAPAVTNSGPTTITGDIGISPGSTVTGFPPGTVSGTVHAADAVALQAKADLVTAYNDAAGRTPATTLAGDLIGKTLVAGIYRAPGSVLATTTGAVFLDGQDNPNAVWVFQITSSLVVPRFTALVLINGASSCNVFWQVAGSTTFEGNSGFVGTIMAQTSITIGSLVRLRGRALAQSGVVTMDNDQITSSCFVGGRSPTATPAPSSIPNTATVPATPQGGRLPVIPMLVASIIGSLALGFGIRTHRIRRERA